MAGFVEGGRGGGNLMPPEVVLRTKGLVMGWGGSGTLRVHDITLRSTQVYVVVGDERTGKTALLSCLTGSAVPAAGTVSCSTHYDGTSSGGQGQASLSRPGQRAWVRGGGGLFGSLTARQNIVAPGLLCGLPPRIVRSRLDLLVRRFGMRRWVDDQCDALSAGQRQIVALCSAFVVAPRLLVLDEPTAALPPSLRRLVWDHLDTMARSGSCVVAATRDASALRAQHRLLLLGAGGLIGNGPPMELMHDLGASSMAKACEQAVHLREIDPRWGWAKVGYGLDTASAVPQLDKGAYEELELWLAAPAKHVAWREVCSLSWRVYGRSWRWWMVLLLVLWPLLLLCMGGRNICDVEIAVVKDDKGIKVGRSSANHAQRMMSVLSDEPCVRVDQRHDLASAISALRAGQVAAVLHLPHNFSQSVEAEAVMFNPEVPSSIHHLADPSDEVAPLPFVLTLEVGFQPLADAVEDWMLKAWHTTVAHALLGHPPPHHPALHLRVGPMGTTRGAAEREDGAAGDESAVFAMAGAFGLVSAMGGWGVAEVLRCEWWRPGAGERMVAQGVGWTQVCVVVWASAAVWGLIDFVVRWGLLCSVSGLGGGGAASDIVEATGGAMLVHGTAVLASVTVGTVCVVAGHEFGGWGFMASAGPYLWWLAGLCLSGQLGALDNHDTLRGMPFALNTAAFRSLVTYPSTKVMQPHHPVVSAAVGNLVVTVVATALGSVLYPRPSLLLHRLRGCIMSLLESDAD